MTNDQNKREKLQRTEFRNYSNSLQKYNDKFIDDSACKIIVNIVKYTVLKTKFKILAPKFILSSCCVSNMQNSVIHTYARKLYETVSPPVEIYRWNQEVRISPFNSGDKVWNWRRYRCRDIAINEKKHDTGVHPVYEFATWKARISVRACCSRLEAAEADFG